MQTNAINYCLKLCPELTPNYRLKSIAQPITAKPAQMQSEPQIKTDLSLISQLREDNLQENGQKRQNQVLQLQRQLDEERKKKGKARSAIAAPIST